MTSDHAVFQNPGRLVDGDLELILVEQYPGDPSIGYVPAYKFRMQKVGGAGEIGSIELRIGNTHNLLMYGGHIGYSVHPEHRGHHYAARACHLLQPLARLHQYKALWITCNPDNNASRRTCELAGANLVEIVNLPEDSDMYQQGERQKCRYRIDLSESGDQTSGEVELKESNPSLWAKWILANSLGELIGLGTTFAIGLGLFSGLAEIPGVAAALLTAGLMTATGVLEGAVVGMAQWLVLRRVYPGITTRAWVWATIIGALIAWFLASLSMSIADFSQPPGPAPASQPPQALVLLVAAGMGLGAGLVLSAAQWRVLRKQVEKAWLWLPANALAWAAGMPLIFAAVDLVQKATSTLGSITVMAAGIALAGAIVGAIHGLALLHLARA